MQNILEVRNLTKCFKDFKLDDISFSIPRGYIMGFIGPNGAGKSTTIKLIMNLIRKDSGHIDLFGKDNIKYEKEVKEKIGFVYDDCNFYEHLSLNNNAKLISGFYKDWDDKLFQYYLNIFGLNPKKKLRKLSKGMKTKFSLALALSHKAEFIIMDEPTSGLDPVFRSEMLDLLYDLIQDENKSVFFSTHITSDLDKIADYITFLNNGKIVFTETCEELFDKYNVIKGDNNLLNDDIKNNLIGIKRNRYGFEALTDNTDYLIKKLNDSIVVDKANLEDIMIHFVGGNK